METITGRLTLPTDQGMVQDTLLLKEQLDADAFRDCDGTQLPRELLDGKTKIYATYYTTRKDNQWAEQNPDEIQQEYLSSKKLTARGTTLKIPLMDGFYGQQLKVNKIHDPRRWWEVMDRTLGQPVEPERWYFDPETEEVVIQSVPYHQYTVSFLAFLIWDPVHMYNSLTNDWKDTPHQMTFDVRQPKTQAYAKEKLDHWCRENPEVDVVRFTTFFHQFTLVFDQEGREKYVDWFGYSASVSPYILEKFEEWAGYPFRLEYIVDQGYFNSCFRVPSREFKDFLEFQQMEVCKLARELVEIVHSYKKEAMMFLGDHWIGTEPFGAYFSEIGLDAVVGSVGDGVTLRMISDISGVRYTEGRLLPYFFPDVFTDGGDPVGEARVNWIKARRAILRSPLDRIGYGGYLKLAAQWPGFMDEIRRIAGEFREILSLFQNGSAWKAGFKVGVLNCFGALRGWMSNQVHHSIYHREIYSYTGVLECLSGLPFDVVFLDFEEIKKGIDPEIGVLINSGDAYTAWSGGDCWKDEAVVAAIRHFVDQGGGLIGVGEPTACQFQGNYFQLSDVLGVERENGFSLSMDKYNVQSQDVHKHFILQDRKESLDFGEGKSRIYAVGDSYEILDQDGEYSRMVVNRYGKGKSVYFTGLPYSPQNCRILQRAIYYAAGREEEMYQYYVTDVDTEIAAFEGSQHLVIINNAWEPRNTSVYVNGTLYCQVALEAGEMKLIEWREEKSL